MQQKIMHIFANALQEYTGAMNGCRPHLIMAEEAKAKLSSLSYDSSKIKNPRFGGLLDLYRININIPSSRGI